MAIKAYIADKYPDKVLSNQSFDVGYFDGNTKCWLLTHQDLEVMYQNQKKRSNTVVRWYSTC